MNKQLDRNRPFAEICGLPGAAFEQDGIMFRNNGSVAADVAPIIEEIWVSEPELNPPSISCIEMPSNPIDHSDGQSLEDMHWRKLKALVEVYGGTWVNRAEAILFIKKGE